MTGKTNSNARPYSGRFVVSALLHCVLLSIILYRRPPQIAPMLLPGDSRGTQLTLTYLPGRAPQPSSTKAPEAKVQAVAVAEAKLDSPKISEPRPTVTPQAARDPQQEPSPSPNTDSPASTNPDATTGADSLGTGNINIAHLDSFRSPRPDLSSLPRGVSGDVVLDITIDTTGKIIALKKLSGLGYGIDESVIATVQAWVFHPATKDGAPVVSEQELHFHYEGGRNS